MNPGTILVLESGAYSDTEWHGPFKVLKELDLRAEIKNFKTGPRPVGGFGPYAFIAWLNTNGFIEDIPHESAHVGSYGEVELDA